MKKLTTISFFTFGFLLFSSLCFAQFNVYHPFPDSNAVWAETSSNGSCGCGYITYGYSLVLSGDTIVNGLTYHKVYQN